jgi:MFS family permease
MYVFATSISKDLGIVFEQQSWVITAYGVTFALSLLFWGRVSDLYSATKVFWTSMISSEFSTSSFPSSPTSLASLSFAHCRVSLARLSSRRHIV